MDIVTKYILNFKDEFMEEDGYKTLIEVNSGGCVDFAQFIANKIESIEGISFEPISNDFFMDYDDVDSDEDSGNVNNFCEKYMNTYGVTKEQFESFKKYLDKHGVKTIGYHSWIYDENTNKHYDIEEPEGVENVFELPIFKRQHL